MQIRIVAESQILFVIMIKEGNLGKTPSTLPQGQYTILFKVIEKAMLSLVLILG